ncbi:hypothetical protein PACTADRAFT_4517 [Pachysolen tannophilus NRRL Y-2460]|uniref:Dihydrolipoamide acetyltransferase component of pyruvate dehydrogenase complex n=1 Tax=Pachysolen tannophilus NRRL Y-2460 TaxID=669874 RepID=A0A1E4TPC3_PACTA|nr:hypothetical protein PACTADRAFT_4517 [Pachysolen tannophilus NRRL Y-2460]
MSPTMDKGGVVKWAVKEGDSFNSGDALLEVETDKAQIDVDAQDDGIMVKILAQNGTQDIPVGKPIAIIAEPGDDIASLELPKIEEAPEAKTAAPAPAPAPAAAAAPSAPSGKSSESAPESKQASTSTTTSSSFSKADSTQRFFPSVELLLELNSISRDDALQKIPASGPKGRITKGDVLAYLGKISQDDVNSITSYIDKKSKIDLSNVELRKPGQGKEQELQGKAEAGAGAEAELGDKQQGALKKSKPEPVKISKTFILSKPVSFDHLNSIVSRATKLSEQYSYAAPLYPKSDLIDPLFEDIIAPSSNLERFKINVKINEPVIVSKGSGASLIFDELTSIGATATGTGSASADGKTTALPSIDIDLIVSDKVVDAKQRAELFIEKFGELLTVPQELEKSQDFII